MHHRGHLPPNKTQTTYYGLQGHRIGVLLTELSLLQYPSVAGSYLVTACYSSRSSCSLFFLVCLGASVCSSQAESWGLGLAGTHCPHSTDFGASSLCSDTRLGQTYQPLLNSPLPRTAPWDHWNGDWAFLDLWCLAEPEVSVQLGAGKCVAWAHLMGAWASSPRLQGLGSEVISLEFSVFASRFSPRHWT